MSYPTAFISSTCVDLYDVRRQIAEYLDSIGINPIRSDDGDIPFRKGRLDKSCYNDVPNSNIYILIISGRYGSISSSGSGVSVTHEEFRIASENDIPLIFAFIKDEVNAEYKIYKRNKGCTNYKPEYVDNICMFDLIDEVYNYGCNIKTFKNTADIIQYLKNQFATFLNEYINDIKLSNSNLRISEKIEKLHFDLVGKIDEYLNKSSGTDPHKNDLRLEIFKGSQFSIRMKHIYKSSSDEIKSIFEYIDNSGNMVDFLLKIKSILNNKNHNELDESTLDALRSIARVIGVNWPDIDS